MRRTRPASANTRRCSTAPACGQEKPHRFAPLVRAATELMAFGGPDAVSVAAASELAGLPAPSGRAPGAELELLETTARRLTEVAVLAPAPSGHATPYAVARSLAIGHRQYVDFDPMRFAALVQLTGACLLGHEPLRPLLAARNRRTRAAVSARLLAVSDVDAATTSAIAVAYTEMLNGIELCHLIDRNEALRRAAYREAALLISARLAPR